MYLRHFGLREYPFSLTPDTSYFYEYASHREALNVLLVALQCGEGFMKLTGEVGLGKTLLCRTLLNCLGEDFVTAYIPDPQLSSVSMRLALAEELGIDLSEAGTQEQILRRITRRLIELARERKRVVLCLDEAQQLPEATLYTTAEPCFLCSFAIREFRIGRVVIGSATPEIGGATSLYPILSAGDISRWGDPPTIVWGILSGPCAELRSRPAQKA